MAWNPGHPECPAPPRAAALHYHDDVNVVHLLMPPLSAYDRIMQEIDAETLTPEFHIETWSLNKDSVRSSEGEVLGLRAFRSTLVQRSIDLVHVYGRDITNSVFLRFPVPYVSGAIPGRTTSFRRPSPPRILLAPAGDCALPEAVRSSFFQLERGARESDGSPKRIGSFGPFRPGVKRMHEQSMMRLTRFRDDCIWTLFDIEPGPRDLRDLDLWVDPATSEDDLDGMTAPALVAGRLVVASHTAANKDRLAGGRAGVLVPPNDPNELVHAIVNALFKPEIGEPRLEAAASTISRFLPGRRASHLRTLYEKAAA